MVFMFKHSLAFALCVYALVKSVSCNLGCTVKKHCDTCVSKDGCQWLETSSVSLEGAQGICVSDVMYTNRYVTDTRYQRLPPNQCPSIDCMSIVSGCVDCLEAGCVWNMFSSPTEPEALDRCLSHHDIVDLSTNGEAPFSVQSDNGDHLSLKNMLRPLETCTGYTFSGSINDPLGQERVLKNIKDNLINSQPLSASAVSYAIHVASNQFRIDLLEILIGRYPSMFSTDLVVSLLIRSVDLKTEHPPSPRLALVILKQWPKQSPKLLDKITESSFELSEVYPVEMEPLIKHLIESDALEHMTDPFENAVATSNIDIIMAVANWLQENNQPLQSLMHHSYYKEAIHKQDVAVIKTLLKLRLKPTLLDVKDSLKVLASSEIVDVDRSLFIADLVIEHAGVNLQGMLKFYLEDLYASHCHGYEYSKRLAYYYSKQKDEMTHEFQRLLLDVGTANEMQAALLAFADWHEKVRSRTDVRTLYKQFSIIHESRGASHLGSPAFKLLQACWALYVQLSNQLEGNDPSQAELVLDLLLSMSSLQEDVLKSFLLSLAASVPSSCFYSHFDHHVTVTDLLYRLHRLADAARSEPIPKLISDWLKNNLLLNTFYLMRQTVERVDSPAGSIATQIVYDHENRHLKPAEDRPFQSLLNKPLASLPFSMLVPVSVLKQSIAELNRVWVEQLAGSAFLGFPDLNHELVQLFDRLFVLSEEKPDLERQIVKAADKYTEAMDVYLTSISTLIGRYSDRRDHLKRSLKIYLRLSQSLLSDVMPWPMRMKLLEVLYAVAANEVDFDTTAVVRTLPRNVINLMKINSYDDIMLRSLVTTAYVTKTVEQMATDQEYLQRLPRELYLIRAAANQLRTALCDTCRNRGALVHLFETVASLFEPTSTNKDLFHATNVEVFDAVGLLLLSMLDPFVKYLQSFDPVSKKLLLPLRFDCHTLVTSLQRLPAALVVYKSIGLLSPESLRYVEDDHSDANSLTSVKKPFIYLNVDTFIASSMYIIAQTFNVEPLPEESDGETLIRIRSHFEQSIFGFNWPRPDLIFQYHRIMTDRGEPMVVELFKTWVRTVTGLQQPPMTLHQIRYETSQNENIFENIDASVVQRWRDSRIASEDPATLFLFGEFSGTCQAITSRNGYNRALVSNLVNGNIKLLILNQNKVTKRFKARAVVRLVTVHSTNRVWPALFLEKTYPENDLSFRRQIFKMARDLEKDIMIPLLVIRSEYESVFLEPLDRCDPSIPLDSHMESRAGLAPYIYSDAASAKAEGPSFKLPFLILNDNDEQQQADDVSTHNKRICVLRPVESGG